MWSCLRINKPACPLSVCAGLRRERVGRHPRHYHAPGRRGHVHHLHAYLRHVRAPPTLFREPICCFGDQFSISGTNLLFQEPICLDRSLFRPQLTSLTTQQRNLRVVLSRECRVWSSQVSRTCSIDRSGSPEHNTRNPKPHFRNPEPERNHAPATRILEPETRNPNPGLETRNSKPETWNPEPEARDLKPGAQDTKP